LEALKEAQEKLGKDIERASRESWRDLERKLAKEAEEERRLKWRIVALLIAGIVALGLLGCLVYALIQWTGVGVPGLLLSIGILFLAFALLLGLNLVFWSGNDWYLSSQDPRSKGTMAFLSITFLLLGIGFIVCGVKAAQGKRREWRREGPGLNGKATLQQMAMRRLLPHALASFHEGKSVTFGAIAVDQKGFTYGKAFLPWGEVKEVNLTRGVLAVSKEGKWFSWCKADAASIPNLFVLLALLYKIDALRTLLKVDTFALPALLGEIPEVER
jgi:hypothetical protein